MITAVKCLCFLDSWSLQVTKRLVGGPIIVSVLTLSLETLRYQVRGSVTKDKFGVQIVNNWVILVYGKTNI